jgi:hypothetical protein
VRLPRRPRATIDVTGDGVELLAGHPTIRAHLPGASSEAAFDASLRGLGDPKVDLADLDAAHQFRPTLNDFLIGAGAAGADTVVSGDITLDDEPRRLRDPICRRHGDDAIDAAALPPAIRSVGATTPGPASFGRGVGPARPVSHCPDGESPPAGSQ